MDAARPAPAPSPPLCTRGATRPRGARGSRRGPPPAHAGPAPCPRAGPCARPRRPPRSRSRPRGTPCSGLVVQPRRLTPDRPGRHVLIAHHEHVGDLGQLGPADQRAHLLAAAVDRGPQARRRAGLDHGLGVVGVGIGHRDDADLLGAQPRRQRAGVVLNEHGHEALDRAEQRPVDHDRLVALVVGADVLQPEALRQLEVELHRRHLPGAADGVAGLHRDLRAVEGAATLVHDELQAHFEGGGAQRLGGHLPVLVRADGLAGRLGRQLEVELVEAVVAQQVEDEVHRADELGVHLLAGAEDVRVVLGHAPHAGQALQHARLLVAVDRAELEEPHRQLAVGALVALVHEDVERAVHRLEVVLLPAVELHRRVHALGEPVQVARLLEERALGDVGRVDELVARLHVALPRVLLHQAADGPALGVEDGEARADLLGEAEEVELGPELAVVAPLGLLQLVQVGGQRLLGLPGRPVNALELGALLVAAPVGAGHPHQLEVAQPAGRGHVRPAAQVDEGVGVAVGADHRAGGVDLVGPGPDGLNDLLLEGLVGEDLEPLLQRVLVADEGLVLLHDRPHLGVDAVQVVVAEVGPVRQLEVVVEAVLDHRPDGVLGARPQPADGLGQDVGGRVAQHLPAGVGVGGDDGHLRPVGQRRLQVDLPAVHGGEDGGLGQAGADGLGQLNARRALGELPRRTVGKTNRDDAWHRVHPFLLRRPIAVTPGPDPSWSTKGTGPPRAARPTGPRGSERRCRGGAPRRPPAARPWPRRRARAARRGCRGRRRGPPARASQRRRLAVAVRRAAPQGQPGRRRRHVLVGAPFPVLAVVVRQEGEPHRRRRPTPCRGRRRRRGCRATSTSWSRPAPPGRRGTRAGRRAARSPTRTAPSRTRDAGTRGRARRRGCRSSRPARAAPAPSTRCATPAVPAPSATPTPARRAATAATARSRAGRACWGPRGCRRARPPAPACGPGRSR